MGSLPCAPDDSRRWQMVKGPYQPAAISHQAVLPHDSRIPVIPRGQVSPHGKATLLGALFLFFYLAYYIRACQETGNHCHRSCRMGPTPDHWMRRVILGFGQFMRRRWERLPPVRRQWLRVPVLSELRQLSSTQPEGCWRPGSSLSALDCGRAVQRCCA